MHFYISLQGRLFKCPLKNVMIDTHTQLYMMTSSKENMFPVTGPLWGESTGQLWIPPTKASDGGLWCFLWFAPEQMAEQTIETKYYLK